MDFDSLINKKEIVFHTAGLGDKDLGVLCDVIRKTQVLESLILSCNHITLDNGKLALAISYNDTIKVMYLSQNKIGP